MSWVLLKEWVNIYIYMYIFELRIFYSLVVLVGYAFLYIIKSVKYTFKT